MTDSLKQKTKSIQERLIPDTNKGTKNFLRVCGIIIVIYCIIGICISLYIIFDYSGPFWDGKNPYGPSPSYWWYSLYPRIEAYTDLVRMLLLLLSANFLTQCHRYATRTLFIYCIIVVCWISANIYMTTMVMGQLNAREDRIQIWYEYLWFDVGFDAFRLYCCLILAAISYYYHNKLKNISTDIM